VDGDSGPYGEDEEDEDEENCAGRVVFGYGSVDEDGRPVGMYGKMPMIHTKSDTNILRSLEIEVQRYMLLLPPTLRCRG
jgi:hypothetical protein